MQHTLIPVGAIDMTHHYSHWLVQGKLLVSLLEWTAALLGCPRMGWVRDTPTGCLSQKDRLSLLWHYTLPTRQGESLQ